MEAVAKGRHLHVSARKVRQVADLVRGKSVEAASFVLFPLKKANKGARFLDKVLKSAVANLKEKDTGATLEIDKAVLSEVLIDGGPIIKRIRPRAKGSAYSIHKNLCHIQVQVSAAAEKKPVVRTPAVAPSTPKKEN